MTEIPFEELANRLTPEAWTCSRRWPVLTRSTGDRLFIRADSAAGTHMIFSGEGSSRQFSNFDGGAVQDLIGWGLLHLDHNARGTPNYRVSGEGLRFFRWQQSRGSAIDRVEEEVRSVTDSSAFAETHPGASHHLREAFELLWAGRTDE